MINPLMVDPWIWRTPGLFRVGDRVRIPFGSGQVEAIVVEDRGNLGVGGRRICRVMFSVDDVSGEMFSERPVDDLTLIAHAPRASAEKTEEKAPTEITCRFGLPVVSDAEGTL